MSARPIRKNLNPESLRLIGIPKSFRNATLSDYKVGGSDGLKEVKNFVTEYINNIDKSFRINSGIFFNGSNGVGKTMLSCIILKEAYRHRYTSRRATFIEYIDKYTKVWSSKSSDEKNELEDTLYTYYKAVEFLVIDELGKEIDSKVATPILEDLLRYREDLGLVTIICTNLSKEVLLERYGTSCMSLIKGNCTPVTIDSKDKRITTFNSKLKRLRSE